MAAFAHSQRASTWTIIVAFLVICHHGSVESQTCRGTQKYRLKIKMNWSRESDTDYRNGMRVGYVISVAHTKDYLLFQEEAKLAGTVKNLVQKNLVGPLFAFYRKQKDVSGQVYQWDYVKEAGPRDIINLNIEVDGDTQATYLSFLGVMKGTPDHFFGYKSLNLCNRGNFTKRFPGSNENFVRVYDGGFDDRTSTASQDAPINVEKYVRGRIGSSLTARLSLFSIQRDEHENVHSFWKIFVIVGMLAIVFLAAFKLLCLYFDKRDCVKKECVRSAQYGSTEL